MIVSGCALSRSSRALFAVSAVPLLVGSADVTSSTQLAPELGYLQWTNDSTEQP